MFMKGHLSEDIFFFLRVFLFYGPVSNTCYQLIVFLNCVYPMAVSLMHYIAVDASKF